MSACVCARGCVGCVCVTERVREREEECKERERLERECVYVCVTEKKRKRERINKWERKRAVKMGEKGEGKRRQWLIERERKGRKVGVGKEWSGV